MHASENDEILLIYDGECPLCRVGVGSFCAAEGTVRRIDKRNETAHPVIEELRRNRLDINRGMVIKYRGQLHQGADAVHLMSRLNTGSSPSARLGRRLFRTRLVTRLCYPFLRLARAVLLRLKGIGPIED